MKSEHKHSCPECWKKWPCSDDCSREYGPPPFYPPAECSECLESMRHEELKRELNRFAAFVEAIRDLLRWLHVVEKLERKADLFFYLVQETATWCACPRDCDGVTHDDCECSACDAWVAISKQTETDRALAEEGEAILAKGATQ